MSEAEGGGDALKSAGDSRGGATGTLDRRRCSGGPEVYGDPASRRMEVEGEVWNSRIGEEDVLGIRRCCERHIVHIPLAIDLDITYRRSSLDGSIPNPHVQENQAASAVTWHFFTPRPSTALAVKFMLSSPLLEEDDTGRARSRSASCTAEEQATHTCMHMRTWNPTGYSAPKMK